MEKTKHLLICACMVITVHGALAQQVYQAQHYGKPGDLHLYNRFSPAAFNEELNQSGEGITWDLSSQNGLHTHPVSVIEPSEGISQFNFIPLCTLSGLSLLDCSAVWSSTDQAIQLADSLHLLHFILSDLQRYQAKVSNLLLENFIGFDVEIGGSPTHAVIVYQVPDTVLHFPIAYGDNWTSSTRLSLDLNAAGQDILYNATQTRLTTIDSWGTLQTPYDTFENVIRLRSDILRLDTIIEQDTDYTILIADQVEFMWLDTNYSLPVMTANGLILSNDSVVINQVEYIHDALCPAPTWNVDLGGNVFYLDDTGSVTIDFNIQAANANMYTWDFGDGQFETSVGSVSHTYHAPGDYSAVVQGCMTNCLPLNSCSFQIFDFVILDTLTSVRPVDASDLGIMIYPNPADQVVTVSQPAGLHMNAYTVWNVNGQRVGSGLLEEGQTKINSAAWLPGVYTICFFDPESPQPRRTFLRFIVSRY